MTESIYMFPFTNRERPIRSTKSIIPIKCFMPRVGGAKFDFCHDHLVILKSPPKIQFNHKELINQRAQAKERGAQKRNSYHLS